MKKIILLLSAIALIAACATKQQNNDTENISDENQPVEQTTSDSDFNTFFAQFKADSVFQKSRIQFPLQSIDYDMEESTTEQIAENEWKYKNFYWDESYAQDENGYTQDIILEGEKAALKYTGVENGISVEYIFERKNGKWFLTTIEDSSM